MLSIYFLHLFLTFSSFAATPEGLFHGANLSPASIEDLAREVRPGSIVVLGENHYLRTHQAMQLAVMAALRDKGYAVAVGMEFFSFPDQPLVDAWRSGQLGEKDFLEKIRWGKSPFSLYRDQALFPAAPASTLAINAPRALTGKIAKEGLESLNQEERSLLPVDFMLGRVSYKQRFLAQMPHIPNPEMGERYFAAQSVWDDTMADQATRYLRAHPEQVLVIVVGEFHVQYGGGLPDRLHTRAPELPLLTVSQVNATGASEEELLDELRPSPEFGPRADYLFVSREE